MLYNVNKKFKDYINKKHAFNKFEKSKKGFRFNNRNNFRPFNNAFKRNKFKIKWWYRKVTKADRREQSRLNFAKRMKAILLLKKRHRHKRNFKKVYKKHLLWINSRKFKRIHRVKKYRKRRNNLVWRDMWMLIKVNVYHIWFWFLYFFYVFDYYIPNLLFKKLLDLNMNFIYFKNFYYFYKLINLYERKEILYSMMSCISNNFIYFLNFKFDEIDQMVLLYKFFSLKSLRRIFKFFFFRLRFKKVIKKPKLKKVLRRRYRRYSRKLNVCLINRFSKKGLYVF